MDYTYSTPTFKILTLEMRSPNHLTLKANGTCIRETHYTVANKEIVLNWPGGLRMAVSPRLSTERSGEKTEHSSLSVSLKEAYLPS